MRCPKCGYFSFDYLAECGKCGVALSDVREKLGLLGIKPNAPFLLGSLLKDGGGAMPAADDWGSPVPAAAATESNLSEIEFGEDFDLDLGPPAEGPPALPKTPADDSSGFSIFDLGVPELQHEVHGDSPAGRSTFQDMASIATLSDEPVGVAQSGSPGGVVASRGAPQTPRAAEPSEGLMFDLSAEDFDEHPNEPRARAGDTGPPSTVESPEDLVIELGDEDPGTITQGIGASTSEDTSGRGFPGAEKEEEGTLVLSLDLEDDYPAQGRPDVATVSPEADGEARWRPERVTPVQPGPPSGVEEDLILRLDEEPADAKFDTVGVRPLQPDLPSEGKEPGAAMDRTGVPSAGSEAEAPMPADDMVIELSDDDLEILLTELEGISDKDAATPAGDPGIAPEKKN